MDRGWETEPNRFEWIYKGYRCLILRNPEVLILCGYIALSRDHVCYGKDYSNKYLRNIDVHGGITYSSQGDDYLGRSKENWWIGFDAGHWMDLLPQVLIMSETIPEMKRFNEMHMDETYRNMNFMRNEAEGVVDQIQYLTLGRLKYERKCRNRRKLYGI